jgi:hypothetical protein
MAWSFYDPCQPVDPASLLEQVTSLKLELEVAGKFFWATLNNQGEHGQQPYRERTL